LNSRTIKPLAITLRGLLCISALLSVVACDSADDINSNPTVLGDPQAVEHPQERPIDVPQEADLTNDILVPPQAPELRIQYQNQSLEFTWDTQANITSVNLYTYNIASETEVLLTDEISNNASRYAQPYRVLQTELANNLYRIELCTATDCVSSYRTAISTPLSSLSLTHTETNTRWRPHLNRTGNVTVVVSEQTQQAEIHFKLSSGWQYATTIVPVAISDTKHVDVALSDTGDTIAVATHQANTGQISVTVFDRLGEGWFETSHWQTDFISDDQTAPHKLLSMSGDASSLIVLSTNGVTRYTRLGLEYQQPLTEAGDAKLIAWDASADHKHVVWLSSTPDGGTRLNRLAPIGKSYALTTINKGMPLLSNDAAFIEVDLSGNNLLLASWQRTENQRHTPSVW